MVLSVSARRVITLVVIVALFSNLPSPALHTSASGPTPTHTPSADVGITLSVSNATPAEGQVIQYLIGYTNNGPETAPMVQVSTPLPAGVTFQSAQGGSYSTTTGIWTIGNVSSGQSGTLRLTGQINPGIQGQVLTLNGLITSTAVDPDGKNNRASVSITVSTTSKSLTVKATPSSTASTSGSCGVYPIALSTQSLNGLAIGSTINVYNGIGAGNFGWLSWTGDPSDPTLVTSLTPPGNVNTYINPANANDHLLTVGKSVFGKPGVSDSKNVRDALNTLETLDIAVPVWDTASGSGNNTTYHITAFASIRILSYQLPG